MKSKEFIGILCKECKTQNIEITEKQAKKLEIYKDLLLEWNEKMNLTAITDECEIIIKHFVDCLECTKMIKEEKNIIDVGTGAGFPGMVLAIYYDNIEFTLLDALNKRLIFLQDVVEKLNLKNVKIVHGRAEEVARKEEFKEQYDASVSRAVAQLPVLLEYTSPFVKVGGKCIVMKGDNVEDEIKLSYNALNTLKLKIVDKLNYNYVINNEEYNRSILKINKSSNTPQKYPRNFGQIKKKPL
ncbi:MAG: 16S rRNA (guanine(527)-N(7))-methyltransferase RsmG [Clostridia bacterium]